MTAKLNLEHILVRINKKINGTWDRNEFTVEEIDFFKQAQGNHCLQDFVIPEDSDLRKWLDRPENKELEGKFRALLGGDKEVDWNDKDYIKIRNQTFDGVPLVEFMDGLPDGSYYVPQLKLARILNIKDKREKRKFQLLDNVVTREVTSLVGGFSHSARERKDFQKTERTKFYRNLLQCMDTQAQGDPSNREYALRYAEHLSDVMSQMYDKDSELRTGVASEVDYNTTGRAWGYRSLSRSFNNPGEKKTSGSYVVNSFVDLLNENRDKLGGISEITDADSLDISQFDDDNLDQLEDLIFDRIGSNFSSRSSGDSVERSLFNTIPVYRDNWNIDYYFKTLFNDSKKPDPLSGNNYFEIQTKIQQTTKVIKYLKDGFRANIGSFNTEEILEIEDNILNISLNFNKNVDDYSIYVEGFGSFEGGFSNSSKVMAFNKLNKNYSYVDVGNPFSVNATKALTVVSNEFTDIYSNINNFLEQNIDIKSKFLNCFGIDTAYSFEKAEGDEDSPQDLSDVVSMVSKIEGYAASEEAVRANNNVKAVVEAIVKKFEGFADSTLESHTGAGSLSVLFKEQYFSILSSPSGNTSEGIQELLVALAKDPTTLRVEEAEERLTQHVRPAFRNSSVIVPDKNGKYGFVLDAPSGKKTNSKTNVLDYSLLSDEQNLSGQNDPSSSREIDESRPVSSRKDIVDVVLDQSIVILQDEKDKLIDKRKNIWKQTGEGSLTKLLTKKRESYLDGEGLTTQEEEQLETHLGTIRDIEKRTGMTVQNLDSSNASAYAKATQGKKGSLGRTTVPENNKKQGIELSVYEDGSIGDGIHGRLISVKETIEIDGKSITIETPRVTLMTQKMEEDLKKIEKSPEQIEEIRVKVDEGFDGRLDFRGEIDEQIDGITGGVSKQTIGYIKRPDGKVSAYVKETATLVVERDYVSKEAELGHDLKQVPDYRAQTITLTGKEPHNLHDIGEGELREIVSIEAGSDVDPSGVHKTLPVEENSDERAMLVKITQGVLTLARGQGLLGGVIVGQDGKKLTNEEESEAFDSMVLDITSEGVLKPLSGFLTDTTIRLGEGRKKVKKPQKSVEDQPNELMDKFFDTSNPNNGNTEHMARLRRLAHLYMAADLMKNGEMPANRELHHNESEVHEIIQQSIVAGEEGKIYSTNEQENFIDAPNPPHNQLHTRKERLTDFKDGNLALGRPKLSVPIREGQIAENNSSIESINESGDGELEGVEYVGVKNWEEVENYDENSVIIANESYKKLAQGLENHYNQSEVMQSKDFEITIKSIEVENGTPVEDLDLPKIGEGGDVLKTEGTIDSQYKSKTLESLIKGVESLSGKVKSGTHAIYKGDKDKYFLNPPIEGQQPIGSFSTQSVEGVLKVSGIELSQRGLEGKDNLLRNTETTSQGTSRVSNIDSVGHKIIKVTLDNGKSAYTMQKSSTTTNIPPGWKMQGTKVVASTVGGCPDTGGYWVHRNKP